MNWFLRARHWQIFLLIFLIPVVIVSAGLIMVNQQLPTGIIFYAMPVGIALSQVSFYGWMWAVGSKLMPANGARVRLFRLFVFIPIVLIGLILVFWLSGATMFSLGSYSVVSVLYGSLLIILPLQMATVFTILYCFMFVARVIKEAESGRGAAFEDYFREFVLVALLPLGIWFLQPRINRLYQANRPG